ncbi:MAG TPA: hypothetical protein VIK11_01840 [Tepidiformaceae bacterium]|jgi:hypothetical protein
MIVAGTIVTLAIFLAVGWAVSTEMFQQRLWRKRVAAGDTTIVAALILEALGGWRRARIPAGVAPALWAGVQGAQLVAVTRDSATVSASAEAEFASRDGGRVQVASALEGAMAIAAKLIDMMLYDVPNLRLGVVRVDVYSIFTGADGTPVQQPILTTTAERAIADELASGALTPAEFLGRFDTHYQKTETGQALAIVLPPVEGTLPPSPGAEGAS